VFINVCISACVEVVALDDQVPGVRIPRGLLRIAVQQAVRDLLVMIDDGLLANPVQSRHGGQFSNCANARRVLRGPVDRIPIRVLRALCVSTPIGFRSIQIVHVMTAHPVAWVVGDLLEWRAVEESGAGDELDVAFAFGHGGDFHVGGFVAAGAGELLAFVLEQEDGAGDVAGEHDAAFSGVGVGARCSGEQGAGVGVFGVVVDLVAAAAFDDAAEVHHRDVVAEVFDDGEVVGDEQVREAELLLQFAKQVENLRLDGDVQRTDRLVADDEAGVERQGAGDADALALAAGELVGVAVSVFGFEADAFEQVFDAVVELGAFGEFVDDHRFADDASDGHARVQRADGVLEDDLHFAAELLHALPRGVEDVFAVETDRAFGGGDEPENRPPDGRLAAAGLADEAERLAFGHVE